MDDQFDVDLVDHALLEEVDLVAELIVVASESKAPLSREEIDLILGVTLVEPVETLVRGTRCQSDSAERAM